MKTAHEIFAEKERKLVAVSTETTIITAIEKMVANKIGAILVKDDDKIVGIWTERDLLRNMISTGFDPNTAKIKDYMFTNLHSVDYDISVNKLFGAFLEVGKRLLLLKRAGRYIGLLSQSDSIKAYYHELRSFISNEFYEQPLKHPRKKKQVTI